MNYQEINKNNLPKWIDTLEYLTSILKENNIKYYLSASGLEYILGSKKYPHDIDIFSSKENISKMYEVLKEYAISDLHLWEDRLLEFQGKYNNIPFEICEWEEEPEDFKLVRFEGMEISILE